MAEIVKAYRQEVPAMRFIGRMYGDGDRVDGGFGAKWHEWFANGWFAAVEQAAGGEPVTHALYEDGDAYIGLMRWCEGEPFQYWIGEFVPPGTPVPDGFASVEFEAGALGVCWLYGSMSDLFGQEGRCAEALGEAGMKVVPDAGNSKAWWFFERYGCPRFTTADENGNVILDVCHYVE